MHKILKIWKITGFHLSPSFPHHFFCSLIWGIPKRLSTMKSQIIKIASFFKSTLINGDQYFWKWREKEKCEKSISFDLNMSALMHVSFKCWNSPKGTNIMGWMEYIFFFLMSHSFFFPPSTPNVHVILLLSFSLPVYFFDKHFCLSLSPIFASHERPRYINGFVYVLFWFRLVLENQILVSWYIFRS